MNKCVISNRQSVMSFLTTKSAFITFIAIHMYIVSPEKCFVKNERVTVNLMG